jgi:hypothetical protein
MTSEISFDTFLSSVLAEYQHQPDPKVLRLGQIFFNRLAEIRPQIANELRGSAFDTYHRENVPAVVSDFVRERWETS